MEQYRTRPPQSRPRRAAPLPSQARRGRGTAARGPGATAPPRRTPAPSRPVPPLVLAVRRLPNPRLTGLGGGLFCAAVMFALGGLDRLLFGASLTVYGALFLPVCALTAVWVRRGDLATAPVVVPIAFTVGLLPVAESDGGLGGRLMGLVTALATEAGWIYGGTLVAGLIVTVRRIRMISRRSAVAHRQSPAPRRPTA